MSRDAERALARKLEHPVFNRAMWHAEESVEALRKRAVRSSWLDLRSRAAREQRSRDLRTYNRALRSHLERAHLRAPNELTDEWALDAMHEELHGRG